MLKHRFLLITLFFVLLVVVDGALIPLPKRAPLKTHPGKQSAKQPSKQPKSAQKPFEINLQWSDVSNNMLYWYQNTNMSLGTPEQNLKLVLMDFNFNYNLRVSTAAGGFQTDQSSTFNRFNDKSSIMWENGMKKKPGPVGKDNMKIAGRSFKSKPFEIMETSPFPRVSYADFSFGRPTGKPDHHFIHSLLKEFQDKVIVLSYDKFDPKKLRAGFHPNLTLSVGNRPEDRCKDDWHYMPVDESVAQEAHWAFKADSVSAGKFNKQKPTVLFFLVVSDSKLAQERQQCFVEWLGS
ncbi:hypothetical protein M3Y97_00924400 [Aphelenchoides bicaudatus]|nr:hypothetical protein M3Y97_00924400 [Aphelenchoides bicaudatus]